MYLALTDEQQFLIEAAQGTLARHDTLEGARSALDGAPGPALWQTAAEAGWTGLLIGEDADGAGLGAYEALLVVEQCGRVLADARLLGHLAATALLEQAGADATLRGALATGERRAALVDAAAGERSAPVQARRAGTQMVFDGRVRSVLDVPDADVLVIVGRDADGACVAGVVDADADGITVTAERAYDATRLVGTVRLESVGATALAIPADRTRDGADLQRALLAAESVGAADACLELSRSYAIDRFAFGRAIGSYQAIKHKLVEMLRRIEGARSLVVHAGRTWDDDRAAFALAANAARVVAADALDYCAPETIFVHGGVGATWEHDASLYYRRAELARRLAGGATVAAAAVAAVLLDEAHLRTQRPDTVSALSVG
ncbi:MAG: acyl-CoA dehydrogenase [Solirubrobacterales bacterium]|nr:acyl-CoA dehydrogenase [Solirubrobacterales bacterium]